MAWVTFNPQGDGVGVDETPAEVIQIFESTNSTWAELHDRGRASFIDSNAVYAVYADDEEIEKEANLQLAAEAAKREGTEVSS